ncbi:MAG: T9SS type A sorting domain-containing protein [Saprospiraceae bacterium]|nr:T9SS type A sorting domain-containing protein [Saprospiraceae bacterium]
METSGQLPESLKFEISDIHGRVVFKDWLYMQNQADVTSLAAGTYFITFISSSLHKKSFKFIKL